MFEDILPGLTSRAWRGLCSLRGCAASRWPCPCSWTPPPTTSTEWSSNPSSWCGSGSRSRYTISVNILKNPLGSVFYDTGPEHNKNQVFPWFSSYHYQHIIYITFTPLLFGIRNKKNIDRKITCSFSQPNTKKYTHVI